MKPAEIRALTDAELITQLETAVQRLFTLHFQRTTQNLESPAALRNTRRDVARLRTILTERQRALASSTAATPPGQPAPKPEQPETTKP